MRVLVIGRSRRRDIEASIYRALKRVGHTATIVDERRALKVVGLRAASAWIYGRARLFNPDRIIVSKPLGMRPEELHALAARVPTVMWYRDLRIPPEQQIVARAREVHTLFLTAGGQARDYEAAGVRRALFLPDGIDPELDFPTAPSAKYACDVAFLGSGGDDYRATLLERIKERFDLRTWGVGWERYGDRVAWTGRPAHYHEFNQVCASAKVVIGIDRNFHASDRVWGYTSNRLWRVLAAGGFYVGPASPGLRQLVGDGEHCALFDDETHALELIERYLRDDAERERVRAQGHAYVLEHHSLDNRLHNLLTGEPFKNPLAEMRT